MKNLTLVLASLLTSLSFSFGQENDFLLDSFSFESSCFPSQNLFDRYVYDAEEKLVRINGINYYQSFFYSQENLSEIARYSLPDSQLINRLIYTYDDSDRQVCVNEYKLVLGVEGLFGVDSIYYNDLDQIEKTVDYEYWNATLQNISTRDFEYDDMNNVVDSYFQKIHPNGFVEVDNESHYLYNAQNDLTETNSIFKNVLAHTNRTSRYFYKNNLLDSTSTIDFNLLTSEYQDCKMSLYIYDTDVTSIEYFADETCDSLVYQSRTVKYAADKERYFTTYDSMYHYNFNYELIGKHFESETLYDNDSKIYFEYYFNPDEDFVSGKRWYHKNLLILDTEEINPASLQTININPNPVNPYGNIRINLEAHSINHARIYNSEGRLVKVLNAAGQNKFDFSAPSNSGLYFIQFFNTKNQAITNPSKFIVR